MPRTTRGRPSETYFYMGLNIPVNRLVNTVYLYNLKTYDLETINYNQWLKIVSYQRQENE